MTIAVTGGTGFIGRHVIAELLRRGIHPTIARRRGNSSTTAHMPEGTTVECDVTAPPAAVFEALGRPDTLIHLAWGGLPKYRSMRHIDEELPAHYRFLRDLITSGLQHCVVAGSCLEYGRQSGELDETCRPHPSTPYGFAKDALRRQLEFLAAERPFALTWTRLFYTYGEGQPATSLYPQLRAAVLRGDTRFDMSLGEQVRDYLPVEQVAQAIVSLALRHHGAGIVNVCSGEPVSVRRLVETWVREHAWPIELNLGRYTYPDYEPLAFWGSRRKLDALLGES